MTTNHLMVAILLAAATTAATAGESNAEKTDRLVAVLQSNAPLFDKARACQQLGEIGTAKAVPELARLLDDEHLAAYARSGLEGIGGPEAADALRNALSELKGGRRIGVVNSLAFLRDARSVDALKALAVDRASGASAEALLALGRIANEPAIDVIRRALVGDEAAHRAHAAAACLLAAERRLSDGDAQVAVALYDAVRTADVPPINRIGATRGAILARKSSAVPFLIEQLRSADRLVRNEALLTVRSIPSEELATALNAEPPKAPQELQVQILAALADCHNAQSLEAIQKSTGSENADVRAAALAALGKIGNREAAAALLKVVTNTRDAADLALAVSGLERLEDPAVDEMIITSLQRATQAEARVHLIRLLESHAVNAAIPDLLKLAANGESDVRVAALGALRAMGGAAELPALVALVRDARDDAVRNAAETAVVAVCRRLQDTSTGLALAAFERATDPAERCAWIRVLASLGNAKTLPAIAAALTDADPAVAAEAARQLGRWPDLSPIEPLLTLAESSKDLAQRARALASAIQLLTVAAEKNQRPADALAALLARAAKSASTAPEKRRLISALGRVAHEGSLRLLQGYYDDPALRNEAAVAIVQIAPALAKQSPSPTLRKLLQSIAAGEFSADIRAEANRIARTLPQVTE